VPQLTIKAVTLAFGGPPVLDGVDLRIERGERICLLGRNGEGKTSLLRLLAGEETADTGEITRESGLRVGLLPQEIPPGLTGSAVEVVGGAAHEAERALSLVGIAAESEVATMSTGRRRRVLLARALAGDPDILLLDEPTNHLDIPAIRRLEDWLRRFHGTVIFVTHDRDFLRTQARRIVELDRGRLRDWSCDYDTFLDRREADLSAEDKRNDEFDRRLAEEEVWVRQGVRERRTRNEGRVRRLLAMREERHARRDRPDAARLELQGAERGGRLVARAEGVTFGYDETEVIHDLDCTILRGDRVGVVGSNGAGKTTLLRLLLGELTPWSGTVRRGTGLRTLYFDQQRETLDPGRTVQENVADGNDHVLVNGNSIHVLTWLQRFLFTPDRARSPITRLSGGERNRLLLARLFTRPAQRSRPGDPGTAGVAPGRFQRHRPAGQPRPRLPGECGDRDAGLHRRWTGGRVGRRLAGLGAPRTERGASPQGEVVAPPRQARPAAKTELQGEARAGGPAGADRSPGHRKNGHRDRTRRSGSLQVRGRTRRRPS